MFNRIKLKNHFIFFVAVSCALPSYSQTRSNPPVPPTQNSNGTGSLPQPTTSQVQSQSLKIAETGWRNICQVVEGEKPRVDCSIIYETFSVEDRIRMLGVEISRKDKSKSLILSTPVGVSLSEGIEVSFEGQNNSRINITGCQASGCFGSIDLSDNFYSNFKKYKVLNVKYSDLNGNGIKLDISLNGFSLIATRFE